jgi:hypothetical protein
MVFLRLTEHKGIARNDTTSPAHPENPPGFPHKLRTGQNPPKSGPASNLRIHSS